MLQLLVNDVLDYSQIQSEGAALKNRPERFLLQEIFNEIKDIFKFQCRMKEVNLNFEVNMLNEQIQLDSIDNFEILYQQNMQMEKEICQSSQDQSRISLHNDKLRLKQILMNLVSNYLKFTKKGQIQVKVSQLQVYHDSQFYNDLIRFDVQDTGTGMNKEQMGRLFNMYATFNQDGADNHNGIGLGLTVAKTLTEVVGPSQNIHVQSEIGQGSQFSFLVYQDMNLIRKKEKTVIKQMEKSITMSSDAEQDGVFLEFSKIKAPRKDIVKQKRMLSKDCSGSLKRGEKKKMKFLIVDDNIFNIKSLEGILKQTLKNSFDLVIDYCMNGEESLVKIKEKEEKKEKEIYDIIFMDINMPVKNGIETVKELNSFEKRNIIKLQNIWLCSSDFDKDTIKNRYQEELRVNRIEQKPILQNIIQDYIYGGGIK